MAWSKRGLALTGCIFGNFVDGYGVVAVAFVGKAIERVWDLSPAMLGLIFAAGPVGMVLGSLGIAPRADKLGRRNVALFALSLTAFGMAAAALSGGPGQLLAALLVTGMGVGGALATLNTLVAELAPPERRGTVMALFSAGYPLGSTAAGVLAIGLMAQYGWQVVFALGAAITVLIVVLNFFTLIESGNAGARPSGGKPVRLLTGESRAAAIGISAAFFLNMLSFYFILLWTARLTVALGVPESVGATSMTIVNVGSLVGPLLFGFLADRLGLMRVAVAYFVAFGAAIAFFAPAGGALVYLAAALVGLTMAGAMTSLYTLTPQLFPAEVRAAGTGLAIGVGRLGAAAGPMLAGLALQAGFDRAALYLAFAVPPLLVAVVLLSRKSFGGIAASSPRGT